MHYGEFAIRTYYLALFIFSAFGALFILLPFLLKDALQKAKIASIILGVIILLLSITFLFTADPWTVLKLFGS
ncbi:VIT1/CCC1 family predicted Fe2+/Mn2+ transporter [Alkalihalobacillus xiaoxiensis]|uniref:VIT1/CCC1 family predicted Fe2+/Mn2+ transporter n=1 Tax=Shouchella xiaoxiensis TaxID=766895 RepID=A0ABS2SV00_9BACI|nr:hypothetical protein [Shouchella xiaoxiensis]MBM7839359.1 VIT1/CCC1 family predicted Fe2+/Mn2+ transporter [Shouchella xiaoxiensis]